MEFLTSKVPPVYALGIVGTFLAVALFLGGAYHLILHPLLLKRHLSQRLSRRKDRRLNHVQILKSVPDMEGSLLETLARQIGAWGKIENLQRLLLQADVYWRPGTFLSVAGLAGCLGFLLLFPKVGLYPALGVAAVLTCLPFLGLRLKKRHKTKLIEKQMPEAMELLARSLRAGHALPSSIELAAKEIPHPLGTELKIVYEEQRLGLGLNAALKRLGERVDSQDLQYFITAVMLQSETGGNLAEVMENLGSLIRQRLKLKGKIQALTAEGRFSALILTLLPFVVFAALTVLSRNYLDTLFTDPAGKYFIGIGLLNIILGILWMQRIIRIRV